MIKTKVLTVLLAGAVGSGATIAAIKTINWVGNNSLNTSVTNISQYIDSSQSSMEKAKNIINKQQIEIKKLNETNAKNLNTINSLNTSIAQLEGSETYSKMTPAQKEKIVITLLKDWGYSDFSISLISKAFAASQGQWPFHFDSKMTTATNQTQKNSNVPIASTSSSNASSSSSGTTTT